MTWSEPSVDSSLPAMPRPSRRQESRRSGQDSCTTSFRPQQVHASRQQRLASVHAAPMQGWRNGSSAAVEAAAARRAGCATPGSIAAAFTALPTCVSCEQLAALEQVFRRALVHKAITLRLEHCPVRVMNNHRMRQQESAKASKLLSPRWRNHASSQFWQVAACRTQLTGSAGRAAVGQLAGSRLLYYVSRVSICRVANSQGCSLAYTNGTSTQATLPALSSSVAP